MSRKYIRISKDEFEKISMNAVREEIKLAQSCDVNARTLMLLSVFASSIIARTMESLPDEVYESDVVDFPNSN